MSNHIKFLKLKNDTPLFFSSLIIFLIPTTKLYKNCLSC